MSPSAPHLPEQALAWRILLHLHCVCDTPPVDALDAAVRADKRYEPLLDILAQCRGRRSSRGICSGDPDADPCQDLMAGIVEQLEGYIGRNGACGYFALEPARGAAPEKEGPLRGYSRDPFIEVRNSTADGLALAAVCYALRGQCLFFGRSPDDRSYNAAKVALNDLYQAYQLAWRLYNSLPESHRRGPCHGRQEYVSAITAFDGLADGGTVSPGTSAYFVYSTLVVCELLRGDVYRSLEYLAEADRHYRHALERFERVCRRFTQHLGDAAAPHRNFAVWFATPRVLDGLFARSKVRFDLGQFLESLQEQMSCLRLVVLKHYHSEDRAGKSLTAVEPLWTPIVHAINFLNVERVQPIIDKLLLAPMFRKLEQSPRNVSDAGEPFDPVRLCEATPPAMAPLVREIVARMGFTLFVLRPRRVRDSMPKEVAAARRPSKELLDTSWLKAYFDFATSWNKVHPEHVIPPSELGTYCLSFLGRRAGSESAGEPKGAVPPLLFRSDVERSLAVVLRTLVGPRPEPSGSLGDCQFYRAVLESCTENIKNLVTIPRRNRKLLMRKGYQTRRKYGDLSDNTVYGGFKRSLDRRDIVPADPAAKRPGQSDKSGAGSCPVAGKFVVLRRWQSYNPKVPHPSRAQVRGGGYLLFWNENGIVIDPGFDFIQNLYDEGFSIDDIDAVIVTHAHPDHDGDLLNLLMLIKEWNEFHEQIGQDHRLKKVDLFLSEGVYAKHAAWLQATPHGLGRVVVLPSLSWDKDSRSERPGTVRGTNPRLELRVPPGASHGERARRRPYDIALEVVPAWHADVITRTSAIGLKIHLYADAKVVGVIGYTGDTKAYGLDITNPNDRGSAFLQIDRQYEDCDILVAHLGDVRLRELDTLLSGMAEEKGDEQASEPASQSPLEQLLVNWFTGFEGQRNGQFAARVNDLYLLLVTLHLVPTEALAAELRSSDDLPTTIQRWMADYLRCRAENQKDIPRLLPWAPRTIFEDVCRGCGHDFDKFPARLQKNMKAHLDRIQRADHGISNVHNKNAFELLRLLVVCSLIPWQYPAHLGIFGVYRLFRAMANHERSPRGSGSRLFIVGELPEELTSYRHLIAYWLNQTTAARPVRHGARRRVYAFTGDIGLHVRCARGKGHIKPMLRCALCDHNNETVLESGENYHAPNRMFETPVKYRDNALIYLCTAHDHHPQNEDYPEYFVNRPEFRVI